MKARKRILSVLFTLLSLFFVFLLFSCIWAKKHYGNLSFGEILFTLSSPTGSTESSILKSFALESILSSVAIFSLAMFSFHVIKKLLLSYNIQITLGLLSAKKSFLLSGRKVIKLSKSVLFAIIIFLPIFCSSYIGLFDYLKQTLNDSSFIADNYIDPGQTKITFPEHKRNLIYIYAESLESSYFSKELGGVEDVNLLEGMTKLTQDNLSFSNTEKFGGGSTVFGTTFTTGALTAQTMGIPSRTSLETFASTTFKKKYLPSATGLGDILAENGYSQYFLIGSDKHFGNRDLLFENHGNYKIYDYYSAINDGRIPSDYYVWWGIEDGKLFESAKDQLLDISQDNAPFNYTILTTNTHHFEGYTEDDCSASFDDSYSNAIYCSAYQIADFISWIKEQDFYSNTTIVVAGDHLSMNNGHFSSEIEPSDRFVYNLFINSPAKPHEINNRLFSTMDLFPTTLAAIGAKIDGDRLALGTNLFSSKKTLLEEYGLDYVDAELSKYSSFYDDKFYSDKNK